MKVIVRSGFVAAAILGASAMPSWANTFIANCGDPTILGPCTILSGGTDTTGSAGGTFAQEWTFQLSDASNLTVSALTTSEDNTDLTYITNWQVFFYTNTGGVLTPVLGTEVAGPGTETDVTGPPPDNSAQFLDLSQTLAAGSYVMLVSGTGGDNADFDGNLKAEAVGAPGPIVGAGLPGLILAAGGILAWRRRHRKAT